MKKLLAALMICGTLGLGLTADKAEASESAFSQNTPETQDLRGGHWYGPPPDDRRRRFQPPPPPRPGYDYHGHGHRHGGHFPPPPPPHRGPRW